MPMIFFFVCVVSALSPSVVLAYIDPATGSILVQGVIAAVAGTAAFLKIYWNKIKLFFKKDEQE